jgi:molecular chaperone DnaK (HSP70)
MGSSFTNREYQLAIAIDFGTARSGYAYQYLQDKNVKEATFRQKWKDSNDGYPKTATEILFAPDDSVAAWGYSAMKKFTSLKEEGKEHEYIFIDNFKTILHEVTERDHDGPFMMKQGKKFSILRLIAEFLRLMKVEVLNDINEKLGGRGLLDESDIRWCLTVPAIWKEDSKQIMRRAAQVAGLIGESDDEAARLLFVLEPEAAAIHCQKSMKRPDVALKPGEIIMVVDAGGGTVDITVHEVKEKGLGELIPCGGGLHGSKYIDKSFREFLDKKLSAQAMNQFQTECPVDYNKLMNNTWETIKCGYGDGNDSKWRLSIELPRSLERIIKNKSPEILSQLANAQNGNTEVIQLTNEDLKMIFKPTVDRLIAEVENQFTALKSQNRPCDLLFLVGGFAGSPLLQNRIQEQFGTRVKSPIVVPDSPGAAVLLGAASFGVDPSLVAFRCATLTYGKEFITLFENGRDPEEKRLSKEFLSIVYQQEHSYDCCDKRFDIFVALGDIVPTDAVVTRQYQISPMATELELIFLSTSNPKVRYADEKDVVKVASVGLRLPYTPKDNAIKTVIIEMEFGSSEVVAHAIDPISGNRERCKFKFSSGYSS